MSSYVFSQITMPRWIRSAEREKDFRLNLGPPYENKCTYICSNTHTHAFLRTHAHMPGTDTWSEKKIRKHKMQKKKKNHFNDLHLSKAAKHKRKTELKLTKQNAHPQIQTTTKPRRVLSVRQMWNAEINPEKQVPARGAEIVSPQLLAAGTASGRLISEPLHFYSATSSECLSCTNSCLVKKKKRKKSGFGGFEWKHFLPTPEATFSRTTNAMMQL